MDSFNVILSSTAEPVDASAEVGEILDAIEARVGAIRGLPAQAPVESHFQARQEFRSKIESESPDEESKQEIAKLKDLCLVLDLCTESDALLQASRDLSGEGVVGYYDPEEKSLTVIRDEDTFGALKWMTYAHEYTHALQDEHFDLLMLKSEEETFDSTKAIGALVEGDAKLVEYLFYESLPPEPQAGLATSIEDTGREFSESQQVTEAPRILRETFGWEHSAGLDFVFWLYLEGGFDAVDKAYENLPRSTEQILHPEKYLSGEGPHDVTLPELASALGNGWHQTDAGVMGELLTGIYLGTFLPEDRTDSAAEGWGG